MVRLSTGKWFIYCGNRKVYFAFILIKQYQLNLISFTVEESKIRKKLLNAEKQQTWLLFGSKYLRLMQNLMHIEPPTTLNLVSVLKSVLIIGVLFIKATISETYPTVML